MPRFFKRYAGCPWLRMGSTEPADQEIRLFKFPQMDFEMAVWEMTHLLIAPKKVFKSIYYHKREHIRMLDSCVVQANIAGYRDSKHLAPA
jgi:hypothetical protein